MQPTPNRDVRACAAPIAHGNAGLDERRVRAQAGPMLEAARRYLRDEDLARRAVVAAFAAAAKAPLRYGGSQRALRRLAIRSAVERMASVPAQPSSIEHLLPRFDESGRRREPAVGRPRSTTRLAHEQPRREQVRRCIDRLPHPYRTLLMLTDIDGFEIAEAAELLGIDTREAKRSCHRARMALLTLLAARTEALPEPFAGASTGPGSRPRLPVFVRAGRSRSESATDVSWPAVLLTAGEELTTKPIEQHKKRKNQ